MTNGGALALGRAHAESTRPFFRQYFFRKKRNSCYRVHWPSADPDRPDARAGRSVGETEKTMLCCYTKRRLITTESTGRRCLSRHCEELLRRSNPESTRSKILDCFAPLAMTVPDTPSRSRDATRPSFARNSRAFKRWRAQGMPDARCTRSLACKIKQSIRVSSPQVHRKSVRHSLRDGVNSSSVVALVYRAC